MKTIKINAIYKNITAQAGQVINDRYIPKYIKITEDISNIYCNGELYRIIMENKERTVLDGDTIKSDYREVRKKV